MEKDKRLIARRPNVLRKLNAENLQLIERGLLGDLPDRLKPPIVPVRGQSNELVVAKPSGLLSSCLPIIPDSPPPLSEKFASDDEVSSPQLKKTFSFRDRIRMSFFGKEKMEKPKWNTIVEDESAKESNTDLPQPAQPMYEQEYKSNKRFWFFRNRDLLDKKGKHSPIYTRSKSFEFLPRAVEEGKEDKARTKLTKNSLSYAFGSSDTLGEATSVESLEYIANVYYDKVDNICLKSIKELQDSDHNSCLSTSTSASSGLVVNMFKTESVQDLLDEFNKAVDMFSENYLSDCEPYTKTFNDLSVKEKRKSYSFNTLPSPKIVHMMKVDKVSDDFKAELSKLMEVKRENVISARTARRGSVTDWFVLEDKNLPVQNPPSEVSEQDKYRRSMKKSTQRVRRVSSTKYVSK